jgi:beta-glucosidase
VYLETVGQVDLGALSGVWALLWSSYNGQRRGEALADVLFGATNPSGRLPFTWYRDESQLPPIDDNGIRPTARTAGRTYMHFNGTPSYPFG